jgi:hypothetical protein
MILTSRGVLTAAIAWLAFGALGLLALSGRGPAFARAPGEMAMVIPAIPIYLMATRFERVRSSEGVLWAAAHGPPFLKPEGVVAVYLLPAVIAIFWVLASRRRAKRS